MHRHELASDRITRRRVLGLALSGTAAGVAALAIPRLAFADGPGAGPESVQVAEIYQLQAAFHRAKTRQDLDLMMSLWAADGSLTVQSDTNSPYVGADQLRLFWMGSGSFTHLRFSLVPSFKTQINVRGDDAWLYFECHDIGDYKLNTRFIAGDTFLAGTVRNVGGSWLFQDMTAGKSSPLSADHYYFP